jgi:hypothetical protein
MSWFVVVPAAWFGIALLLGLLVGRCLRAEGIAQPVDQALAEGAPAPMATDAASTGCDDSHSVLRPDHALARTV